MAREELNEIPHVLACDVGNTCIHFAHVQGEEVLDLRTLRLGELSALGEALAQAWAAIPQPRQVVAASVNPAGLKALEATVLQTLDQEVLVVGRDIPLPMPTDLPEPASIGADRLCTAVAAFDRLGTACIVGDFGSAITIDCVSDEGVFLGGAILPGLTMSAQALHEKTAQLPLVQPAAPQEAFGRSTSQAIIGGLFHAARGALKELSENYATAMGQWPTVVVTGGDAELVVGDLGASEVVQAIVPDLCLRGVAIAYYRHLITSD